ncbi:hypothetical protein GP486_002322 [Trichoglossum hirsutum]|uniref:Transcription elongation factor 1 homolog n=1 Tax=Trichoglossum hirsutum TaxID=265104 RepID=A0A9P8RRS7_9PEZI|nr:hypothetical protein GP486_002322 [Trichoglossum hirsutum]
MGKRKKSSRKPQGPKKREPLPSTFACLFCNHEKSVTVKLDKKVGVGQLHCKVCGQSFQSGINCQFDSSPFFSLFELRCADCMWQDLSAPVDVYSDWVDACDSVAKGDGSTERGSTLTHRELERGPLPGKEPMQRYVGEQDANENEDYDEEIYAED